MTVLKVNLSAFLRINNEMITLERASWRHYATVKVAQCSLYSLTYGCTRDPTSQIPYPEVSDLSLKPYRLITDSTQICNHIKNVLSKGNYDSSVKSLVERDHKIPLQLTLRKKLIKHNVQIKLHTDYMRKQCRAHQN